MADTILTLCLSAISARKRPASGPSIVSSKNDRNSRDGSALGGAAPLRCAAKAGSIMEIETTNIQMYVSAFTTQNQRQRYRSNRFALRKRTFPLSHIPAGRTTKATSTAGKDRQVLARLTSSRAINAFSRVGHFLLLAISSREEKRTRRSRSSPYFDLVATLTSKPMVSSKNPAHELHIASSIHHTRSPKRSTPWEESGGRVSLVISGSSFRFLRRPLRLCSHTPTSAVTDPAPHRRRRVWLSGRRRR